MGRTTMATAGELVRFGHFNAQVAIKEPCENKTDGHWACITHNEDLRNQFMKDSHIDSPGNHHLVWICHAHGPEKP